MAKPLSRARSRYSSAAVTLLGQLIRKARIERKLTTEALATRAGLSRGLVQRIEKGDPRCSIGAAFEAAAVVGVRLFDADQSTITNTVSANAAILALLPKAVHPQKMRAKDDF